MAPALRACHLLRYGAHLAQRVERWTELRVEGCDPLLLVRDALGGVTRAAQLMLQGADAREGRAPQATHLIGRRACSRRIARRSAHLRIHKADVGKPSTACWREGHEQMYTSA